MKTEKNENKKTTCKDYFQREILFMDLGPKATSPLQLGSSFEHLESNLKAEAYGFNCLRNSVNQIHHIFPNLCPV